MPPKEKKELLNLENFSVSQLPELQGKKEEIKSIIDANPIVKIVDTETYEAMKKSRTAVKTLRTGLEKEQTDVKRKIKEHVLDVVDKEYNSIVSDVKSEENLRQAEVTAWEDEVKKKKAEKERLEKERVDNIKIAMDKYVSDWKAKFNALTFDTLETVGVEFVEDYTNFDANVFEEFQQLFPNKIDELTLYLSEKSNAVTEAENSRLEKIRLAKEKEELDRKNAEIEEKQKTQKLAEDKFAKEQADFAKQKAEQEQKSAFELKQNGRIKQLTDLGLKFDFQTTFVGHDFFIDVLDIKTYEDEKWDALISKIETKKSTPLPETIKGIEVENKALELLQNIDSPAPEPIVETKNESLVEKLIPIVEEQNLADLKEMQKEITWESIFQEFKLSGEKSLSIWLTNNYNVPTKIQ